MGNSKGYFVARIVPNEAMQHNGYMDFLCHEMKEQISDKILDIISDGNEYAIKLLPERRIKNPNMTLSVEIRQGISVKELVHCKDCKCLRFYEDGTWWCEQTEREIINPNWFCADGERRDPCSSQDS